MMAHTPTPPYYAVIFTSLRTDGDQPSDNLTRLTEASGTATKTVADHIDRLTGKLPLCAFEHRFEILRAPICPRGLKAFH